MSDQKRRQPVNKRSRSSKSLWNHPLLIRVLVASALLLLCGIGTALANGPAPVVDPITQMFGPLPPSKATYAAQHDWAGATAQASAPRAPKPANYTPPADTPGSLPTLVAGIDNDTHQGPFPPSDLLISNTWLGPVGATWEYIYAGTKSPDDANIGAVRIYRVVPQKYGYVTQLIGTFLAPGNVHKLKVTAVNGLQMSLLTDQGQTITFDLQTNQFT